MVGLRLLPECSLLAHGGLGKTLRPERALCGESGGTSSSSGRDPGAIGCWKVNGSQEEFKGLTRAGGQGD